MTDKEKQQIADALITALSTLYMCESWANNLQHLLQVSNARKLVDNALNKLNSLPDEQSEDLEEEIESYLTTNRQYAGGDEEDLWSDDCVRDAIKHGANWQKEQTINKTCEWLNKKVVEYHPRTGALKPIVNLNAFREAMEDEQ